MTLDGIARQLEAIRADITGIKGDITGIKGDMAGMKTELKGELTGLRGEVKSLDGRMTEGFRRVDEELNAAKIRDEEAIRLLNFGLEAREGLRESVDARFDATDKKHDEEIGLLKDVLRSVTVQKLHTPTEDRGF